MTMDVNSPDAAQWSENMRLKSENEFLRGTLQDALLQLEYLETKYPTGTGAAMVARVTAALTAGEPSTAKQGGET